MSYTPRLTRSFPAESAQPRSFQPSAVTESWRSGIRGPFSGNTWPTSELHRAQADTLQLTLCHPRPSSRSRMTSVRGYV